ncbi:MAG: sensor histidine kinase, partial [Candidatus Adiutrix sp.]
NGAMGAALSSDFLAEVPSIKTRVLNEPLIDVEISKAAAPKNPLLQTAIEMGDGSWLEIWQPLNIVNPRAVWRQRLFILLESVLFSILLIWMIRRATRPLNRLGKAAEQFGLNPEIVEPLPETGSKEIRDAALSFNRMRERIRRNLEERNRMLEAMGHDLRTPLAKIQLRLDKISPPTLKNQFAANINEIESLIEQGLELAGSLQTSEATVPLDIVAFAHSLVDDLAEQGLDVSCHNHLCQVDSPILVMAKPTCLKRCFENLLTNAVKYAGSAKVSLFRQGDGVVIEVNDNGLGIPEEFLEKVFEPYYRLERSRNRDFGGTGLGLSIAKNMVLLNNGSLQLKNRPEGGLSATVRLKPLLGPVMPNPINQF